MTPPRFEIRLAGVSDAALIATQRSRMFQEMDLVPESLFESYRARCETRIREMLQSGEYIGWLARPDELRDKIVAGVGVQLRNVLPHPVGEPGGEVSIGEGRHAIIINVFTEPNWRAAGSRSFWNKLSPGRAPSGWTDLSFTLLTKAAPSMSRWVSSRLTRCVSRTGSTFRKSGKVVRYQPPHEQDHAIGHAID